MTTNALLERLPLDYAVELPVLGLATRFETNDVDVRAAIEQSFGGWRAVSTDPARSEAAPFRVSVIVRIAEEFGAQVRAGGGTDAVHVPVRHIAPDAERLIVHSPGSVAVCDPARRESVAYVTSALVADRAHFRSAMLEAVTLALLSHFDRHPVHAAAVARPGEGRALLLAGPSGAGKSTLTYAAHLAGFDVLGEDRVWIQLQPWVRVWGWPGDVRLRPEAGAAFPDAVRLAVPSDIDGASKLAMPLAPAPETLAADWKRATARYVAASPRVCLLDQRRVGTPTLTSLAPAELCDALTQDVAPGFDRFPERHRAVASALALGGGWRLALSHDARAAVPLLERMLAKP